MKEHPIIFSGPMVRAILDGRKTQTRRVVKPQPSEDWSPAEYGMLQRMVNGEPTEPDPKRDRWGVVNEDGDEGHFAPCGPVGDRLWVRETWRAGSEWDREKPSDIDPLCGGNQIRYEADGEMWEHTPHGSSRIGPCKADDGWGKVRPSIFMPRWASRITLEVAGVRVERVQEISPADCVFEGMPYVHPAYRDHFIELWDSLNAKRGFGWDANPWVFVYEFKVVKP